MRQEQEFHDNREEEQEEEYQPMVGPRDTALGIGSGLLSFGVSSLIGHYDGYGFLISFFIGLTVAFWGVETYHFAIAVKDAFTPGHDDGRVPHGRSRKASRRRTGRDNDEEEEERYSSSNEDDEYATDTPLFASCPRDQQLRLGKGVPGGQRFDVPINALLGKGMIIAGSQGAGKSNITGLCATHAGKCLMPLLVIDLKREFYTLIETVPNGIRAGHPAFADECSEGGYFPLTEETADEFAAMVMEQGFQAVLDVPSYNGNNDEVALVIAATLNALMDWSQQQQEGDRLPCLVITDEAHNFLPQSMNISAMRMHADSFDALQSAYSRMINTGRSYGYTMVMATQRIANIAKWAIANLQVKVIMKHAEKNDLDRCEQEVGAEIADRNIVKGLPQGTGIVVGLTKEPVTVAFDRQPARHVSNTPSIERAHQRFRHADKRPSALPGYAAGYAPIAPLAPNPTRQLPDIPVAPMARKSLRDKQIEAISTWERLMEEENANVRSFASAMDIPDSKAYATLDKLQKAGLIEWQRRKKA